MNKKITFPELVENIAELTNSSKRVSELFLKELFGIIKEQLEQGENVKVKNLGVFKVTDIASRKSININTGEEIEIPAHRKVSFNPDKSIAEAINTPFEGFETIILDDDIIEEDLIETSDNDDSIKSDEIIENEIEDIPQPPAFTFEDDESKTDNEKNEITTELEVQPVNHDSEKEDLELNSSENIDSCEQDISTESQLPVVIQNNYIDDEYEMEVKREKRKSFFGGIVACLSIIIIIGYISVSKGYVTMNFSNENEVKQPLTEITNDSVTTDTTIIDIKSEPVQKEQIITDTIRNNYYLTKMSRKYYGSYEFWVYIYEENKEIIPNPNNVSPGLVVIIPPAEKYNIDKNNPESIKKAKERAEMILKQ